MPRKVRLVFVLIAGGSRTLEATGGLYVEPAIFDGVTNAMTIAREEIFGPVLSLITFDTVMCR